MTTPPQGETPDAAFRSAEPGASAQTEQSPAPRPQRLKKTFSAFSVPAYRLLWASTIFSFLGMQMQMVGRGLLAYEIGGTNSAIAVVSLATGVPMLLFSLIGGTVADRVSRRKVLIITQFGNAGIAIAVAALVATGAINLPYLILTGVLQGMIFSFGGPARNSFVPEIVGEKHLLNAIALNSAAMNLTRIAGPSLAGALVALPWIDIQGVFVIQAAFNSISAVMLAALPFMLRNAAPQSEPVLARAVRNSRASMTREFLDGMRYIIASPILLTLLLMGLVPTFLGMAYQAFLPVFAKDVFGNGIDRNSEGLGLMMTMTGLGALVGSLVVASLQDYPRRTVLQLFAGLGFGLAVAFFAAQTSFVLAIAGLVAIGFMANFFQALNSAMVMSASDPAYYGRVMAVNMMTFALMPVGTLPIGFIADRVGTISQPYELAGIQVALFGAGVLIVAFVLAVTVRNRAYRELEQDDFRRFASMANERLQADSAGGSAWQQIRRSMNEGRGAADLARPLGETDRSTRDS